MRNILTSVPGKKEKLPLSVTHPKFAKEAHGWNPSDVLPGSGKKYEWICSKKHIWSESCNSRTNPNRSKNSGCPYCKNVKVLRGYNDLKTLNPTLAKEADGWDPSAFLAGSHKKVNWKCSRGHKWEAALDTRSVRRYGCPFCSGRRPIRGETDLGTTHPEVAKEADGWDPTTVKKASNKKLKWKCKLGHNWTASPGERISGTRSGKPNGCPFCSGQRVLKGFNDLKTTNPALAKEAYKWDPSTLTSGASVKKEWQCNTGHIWEAVVSSRMKSGCPFCSGRRAIKGENDLKTLNPKLARELVDANSRKLKLSSHTKVNWKCKYGHIWEARVADRSKGQGCPICVGKKILIGFNDLKTTHPQLAKEADGWDPRTTTAGSGVKRNWKCKKGHLWSVSSASRSGFNTGCPTCSGHKLLKGFNDLKTMFPKIAKEAYGWDPTSVGLSYKKKLSWKCSKGHIFESLIENRRRGDGCQYCSGHQCLPGFNDLSTTDPKLAKQAVGWDPSKVSRGSGKRVKWKCNEGHTWMATPNTRTSSNNNATGCPGCEINGFNPEKDAYVYLIKHTPWKMLQIGITNSPKSRLAKHRQKGWVQVDIIGPIKGRTAKNIETKILNYLKFRKVTFANKAGGLKFDGWTEAWSKSTFEVKSIKELMRLTEEFEE